MINISDIPTEFIIARYIPEGTALFVDSRDYSRVLFKITNIGTSEEDEHNHKEKNT